MPACSLTGVHARTCTHTSTGGEPGRPIRCRSERDRQEPGTETPSGKPLLCARPLGVPWLLGDARPGVWWALLGECGWADAEILLNRHSHHLLRQQAPPPALSPQTARPRGGSRRPHRRSAAWAPVVLKVCRFGQRHARFSFHPATRKAETTSVIASAHPKTMASCPREDLPL